VKTSTETVPTRHTCPLLTSPEHPGRLAGHAAWRGVPEGYYRAGESSDEADSSPPLPVGVGVNSALQCGLRAESHYRLPHEAAYLAHRGRLRQEEAYQLGVGLGYGLRVGPGMMPWHADARHLVDQKECNGETTIGERRGEAKRRQSRRERKAEAR